MSRPLTRLLFSLFLAEDDGMEAQNPSKSSAAESPTESRESHSQLRSLQGMAVMRSEQRGHMPSLRAPTH
ncbi:hypothetical protein cyc_06405 [Cyclospora cayetanensis]|uniref:Uncharacterized protein n=1 Tax=Cyclospora cayetanensis TaxID=88456 RepID=A0A1D3CTB4_9EIME|nr:hypothetical protein cyc_06405 [Cyclospora cayetanensis]